jgi:hypothetical protein
MSEQAEAYQVKQPDVAEVVQPEAMVAVVRKEGVEGQSGASLLQAFAPFHGEIAAARDISRGVSDGENPTHRKLARECRLALRRTRCAVEDARKNAKADALRYGKAVDGLANVLKFLCEPEEARLEEIEQYEVRKEAARIAALVEERAAALMTVEGNPAAYNLAAMDEATWAATLATATKLRDDRIEAARKIEAERVAREKAEAEERARIKAENERLKAEAEARAKAEAVERAKVEAERRKIEAEREAEREAADAAVKAERDARAKAEAEAAEREAKIKAAAIRDMEISRKAREEAERKVIEAQKKAEAEANAIAEAERIAEAAPDREKLLALAAAVRALPIPAMVTEAGNAARVEAAMMRDKMAKRIEDRAVAMGAVERMGA